MIKKFFSILEKEDKKRFFLIVFLMAIMSLGNFKYWYTNSIYIIFA